MATDLDAILRELKTPPPGFDSEGLEPPMIPIRDWPVNAIALDTSGRCNLSCLYCAEAATQPDRPPMSSEMLRQSLDFLFSFPVGRGRHIHIGSGEPLLALPLLRKLQQMIQESGEPVTVHMTTNGTRATTEVCDWLAGSGWEIKISLDGPLEIQDHFRPHRGGQGSYALTSAAVRGLAQRMPWTHFSVTAVICHGTDPESVVAHLTSLGVRRIDLVPVASHDPALALIREDIERYAAFMLDHARRYVEMVDWDTLPYLPEFRNAILRYMGYQLARTNCSAGRSFTGVGPDGSLYPCFRFIGIEEFRLGDVRTGLDSEAHRAFQAGAGRAYEARSACIECWAAPLCGGTCFAVSEMFGPGAGEPFQANCAFELATVRAAVWLVEHLRQHDPDRLLAFLPQGFLDAVTSLVD